jgi:hypothetical protein
LYEKFRTFCNILYEFTYPEPEPEPGLKTWDPAPAPPKSGRSTGSGSATLVAEPHNVDVSQAGIWKDAALVPTPGFIVQNSKIKIYRYFLRAVPDRLGCWATQNSKDS